MNLLHLLVAAGVWMFYAEKLVVHAGASGSSKNKIDLSSPLRLHGGGTGNDDSPYQLNPNYVPPSSSSSSSSFDKQIRQQEHEMWIATQTYNNLNQLDTQSSSSISSSYSTINSRINRKHLPPATEYFKQHISKIHRTSPTVSYGSLACTLVFIMWQIPVCRPILQRYFVCSRPNFFSGRFPVILLSAISHVSFSHLLVNLFAFVTFGIPVKEILSSSSISSGSSWRSRNYSNWHQNLWPFVLGSAVTSSIAYLLFQPSRYHGGCLGLSGVTLSLLAMQAKVFPTKEFGFLFGGFIPVRLPAYIMLNVLIVWSVVGSLFLAKSGVAHVTHLGGLLFGIAYYEIWDHLRQRNRKQWRQK